MTLVISFGLMFIMGLLLMPVFEPSLEVFEHTDGFAFGLLIGGFILSGLAYTDLSNSLRRYSYLTLPVSNLERFLCMWLLTSLGWIVLYTIIFSFYTVFANALGHALFSHITFVAFQPLGEHALNTMKYYFVLHGIFLVGAAHFKGYVFPKTLFTLILFAMFCGLIAYFFMADLMQGDADCLSDSDDFENMSIYKYWLVLKWIFWWLLAPICWLATYMGLKEKEA